MMASLSDSDQAGTAHEAVCDDGLPLGEELIRAGLISHDDLAAALGKQKGKNARLGEVLVELGFIDDVQLMPFLEKRLQIKGVRLRDGMIDPDVVNFIPRAVAESLIVLPLFQVHRTLTVAMAEPRNLQQRDELARITGLRIRPVFGLQMDIVRMIERVHRDDFAVDAVTANLDGDAIELSANPIDMDLGDLAEIAEGSPIINLVNYIIVNAVKQGASDVHIEQGEQKSIVRYRVDGQLHEVLSPRTEFHPAIVSRIKVMARMDIAEHRISLDGRMTVIVDGKKIDLRISTLPTVSGENVVMRLLDRSAVSFDLGRLGMTDETLNSMKSMLRMPHGLLLVTGPTGSGKSTTLYSSLELVKSIHNKIITVEDPVEYRLDLINQVQADSSSAMSFADTLRAFLRQDPDIIMVGEIRDRETAEVAIQAALTGHLVLSTLHTNDSASAVTRLLDMGIADFKISAALIGVLAQRLVRLICPHCRRSYFPPSEVLDALRYTGNRRRPFERGEGCTKCHDTGHSGRVGVYELLTVDGNMRQMISKNPCLEELRQTHLAKGGKTLLDDGMRLAQEGKTSLEEVAKLAFGH